MEAGIDPERDRVEIGPIPGAAGPAVSFGLTAAKALEEGKIDGFWANAMGAEIAVSRGAGTVVLDVRRGDGPPAASSYTFPAVVATEKKIEQDPKAVEGAIRAVIKAQKALRADTSRATEVGRKIFPPTEAETIAKLIERDLPYYDPSISQEVVAQMNRFAQDAGLLTTSVPYDQVVAATVSHLWKE